jgi:hypothetical protein
MSNSETVFWQDAGVNPDEVISSKLYKGAAEILGYKCDELVLTCKSGIQKYYFNTKLFVDSKLYANHKFGNWYDYLSKANALPLKIIIENPEFTLISVATEIKQSHLDEKIFELPAGVKMEKQPPQIN